MRRSSVQGLVVGVAVLGLLVLGGTRRAGAVTVSDGCTDAGGGRQDIASLTATFDATTETITVDLVLCAAPDAATKYRVHFDHTAPFFDDADRNGDGVVDANDFCATTSDNGMVRKGTKNTGPGTITVVGSTLHYEVSLAALNPALMEGDTVYIWADTQTKSIVDRAPNTDRSDGCADPEEDTEVLALSLTPVKRVFVTSTLHQGNLGGLAGADAICQELAGAAGLSGTFKAWLSDATTSAADRLTHATVPYVRVDDIKVADDWTDLVDGVLDEPISIDENGAPVSRNAVWTGTDDDGSNPALETCEGWTSAAGDLNGEAGSPHAVDRSWTTGPRISCSASLPLYCFEQ
jgi:hypothetical protein